MNVIGNPGSDGVNQEDVAAQKDKTQAGRDEGGWQKDKGANRDKKSWERGSDSGNSPNELNGNEKAHRGRFGKPPEASFASSSERAARSVNS